jgi:hypothetical protein
MIPTQQGGSGFAGEARIKMIDNTLKRAYEIRRGDVVWTPIGGSVVEFAIEFGSTDDTQPMTQVGSLRITPRHPIIHKGQWAFPSDLFGYTDHAVSTVYNFVLEKGHVIQVEDIDCCTLAHGFRGPVIEHAFFGTRKCVNSLLTQPGFVEGRPVFTHCVAIPQKTGLIGDWVDLYKDTSIYD